MKWYTFGGNNKSDKVNLLLDHNTTATVAWNTNDDNSDSSQIEDKIKNDTTAWNEVLNSRLITANEIAKITNHPTFDSETANNYYYFDTNSSNYDPNRGPGTSKYAWLFDKTNVCKKYGCNIEDSSNNGYWTNSAFSGSSSSVWHIDHDGTISSHNASINSNYGIRPVITIPKSIIL